ncbi:ArnT family glycosyltransferase [Ancylobacter mangrovi]|uniref:ArnT family glycosyltransferase n=1 Tax=Ancylobacter mangrovi TaxID=2972472 RepID=UPI0021619C04|nr:glycosyltransferase family 39 protein [Ancylobacter mangrovi]MCS0502151.1 glycosyltransferase family 39 protein [Ancylobacter mangrovi]
MDTTQSSHLHTRSLSAGFPSSGNRPASPVLEPTTPWPATGTLSPRRADGLSPTSSRIASLALIALIVTLALALRVSVAQTFAGMVDGEGAEYLSLAKNLLAGHGYVGISTPGVNLFFPPLFPMAIAGLGALVDDVDLAGRMLSVALGAALTIPVYFIAQELYGRSVAVMAAGLVAVHPFLVSLATTVQVESAYALGILTGMVLLLRAFRVRTVLSFAVTGLVFGLSFLVRGEALVFMLLALTLLACQCLAAKAMPAGKLARRAGVLLLAFGLVAAPYVVWLSQQVGQFKLEGKSPLNITVQRAKQAGIGEYGGAFLIGPDLEEQGAYNVPSVETIRSFSMTPSQLADYLVSNTSELMGNTLRTITTSGSLGYPLLLPLVLLGLVASAWSSRTLPVQLSLLGLVGMSILATYFIYFTSLRFFVPLLLCMCIWAAAGLWRIREWAGETADAVGLSPRLSWVASGLTLALAASALLAPPLVQAANALVYTRDTRQVVEQAQALQAPAGQELRIAAASAVPSYHAHAQHIWLPYTESEATALRYLEKKGANFVIVRGEDGPRAPYLARWVARGIIDRRAQLVSKFDVGHDEVRIYRLDWN